MRWILLIILIFFNSCNQKSNFVPVKESSDKIQNAELVIRDFTAQGFKFEKADWELFAKEAYIIKNKKIIYIFNPFLTFFENEKPVFLRAEKGIVYTDDHLMEVENKVMVTNSEGKRLETESLIWNEKKKLLTSDKYVKITFPEGDTFEGIGMTADSKLDKIILKEAKGYHPAE
ncbi:MAG: LPS export ABC transporter periplasmic protein LptC [Spirochaetia bacterium]|nr:LPS export ABC transporter periplasmic protein LptC [Spirochaetia bacterium]